ncbi:hypothetical protein SDJN03_15797, partial [Cucurbita argyrosperma subsp. sororia]
MVILEESQCLTWILYLFNVGDERNGLTELLMLFMRTHMVKFVWPVLQSFDLQNSLGTEMNARQVNSEIMMLANLAKKELAQACLSPSCRAAWMVSVSMSPEGSQ